MNGTYNNSEDLPSKLPNFSQDNDLNLSDLWFAILRRKKLIGIITTSFFLLTAFYSIYKRFSYPLYKGSFSIMIEDPLVESRIETLVGSAYQQGEIEYLERKEVAIALALKMSGLAEILVDASGHMNENLSQTTFLMTRNAIPKSERKSGIVIDARNIYHVPAMVPKVFNENDKLIYGPRHYTRSRSVNRGPMGYAHSMDDGNVRRRVGLNPIVIEAISSEDTVNLTISNIDAERIRDAEKKFGLLTNCKVLVLLK